ncbi:MAG TPA: hypothetical protein VN947_32045 [Polyangia bacterium]|nr:hypothetical protein [Polyangia bacterium]
MLSRIFLVLTLLTAPAAADSSSRAARHFASGQLLFAQGRLRDAAAEFKRAFELDPRPRYLYDAAQSTRMAGDCATAVPLYQAFARIAPDEDARNAAAQNLQRCQPAPPVETAAPPEPATAVEEPPVAAPAPTAEPSPSAPPPATTTPPSLVAAAPPPAPAKPSSARLRWMGGVGGATAGALLLSATILEGQGAARFDELTRTCAPSCSSARVSSLERELDAATGLFVAAGLVTAAAVVAILITHARARR